MLQWLKLAGDYCTYASCNAFRVGGLAKNYHELPLTAVECTRAVN